MLAAVPLPDRVPCDRLIIRTWETRDVVPMEQLIAGSLDHLRPWMAWAYDEPISQSRRLQMFARWERHRTVGRGAIYAVFDGVELMGGCAIHRRVGPGGLDIGYWLGANAVGRGHATSITRAIIDMSASRDDVSFVQISHDSTNTASGAVANRIGFVPVALPGNPNIRTWRLDTPLDQQRHLLDLGDS